MAFTYHSSRVIFIFKTVFHMGKCHQLWFLEVMCHYSFITWSFGQQCLLVQPSTTDRIGPLKWTSQHGQDQLFPCQAKFTLVFAIADNGWGHSLLVSNIIFSILDHLASHLWPEKGVSLCILSYNLRKLS